MSRTLNIIIFIMLLAVSGRANIHYVKADSTGNNNGTSWTDAWYGPGGVDSASSTSKVSAGDTVFFYGIIYDAQLQPIDSCHYYGGNGIDNTITHGGGTICGSKQVTGWGSPSGNVYPVQWAQGVKAAYNSSISYTMYQVDTVNNDTTWINRQSTIEAVDAEGEYFQPATNDSFYVYVNNMNSIGLDPDDYIIYSANDIPILFGYSGRAQQNVYMEGLHFQGGRGKILLIGSGNNHADSCTIRACNGGWVAQTAANNAGVYGSSDIHVTPGADTLVNGHNNRFIHDTANHVNVTTSGADHANGWILYSQMHCKIDSCVCFGDLDVGYQFKGTAGNEGAMDGQYDDVIRWCYMDGENTASHAVMQSTIHFYDSVYGCIFESIAGDVIHYKNTDSYSSEGEGTYVGNNTIYSAVRGFVTGSEGPIDGPMTVKYNIFHSMSGDNIKIVCSDCPGGSTYNDTLVYLDSNMYYTGGSISWGNGASTYTSLETWQAAETMYDPNSSVTDPGFDSLAAADPWAGFARSGASEEMSISYGGINWNRLGAVQVSVEDTSRTTITGPINITGAISK